MPGSPYFSGGTSAVNLAMNPGGEFLFVVHVVSDSVTTMARQKDGSLSFVPGSPQVIGGDVRKAVAGDRFLYVTDESSIDPGVGVMVYEIEDDGLLTLVPGSPFAAGARPQDMVLFFPEAAFGDGDGDGDVDLDDFAMYHECFTGPNPTPGRPPPPGCDAFDVEPDGDVDFHDFSALQRAFDLR